MKINKHAEKLCYLRNVATLLNKICIFNEKNGRLKRVFVGIPINKIVGYLHNRPIFCDIYYTNECGKIGDIQHSPI